MRTTHRLEICQGPVLAGLGHGLHGVDVAADVLERELAAHDVLNVVRTEKNKTRTILNPTQRTTRRSIWS